MLIHYIATYLKYCLQRNIVIPHFWAHDFNIIS